MDEVLRNARIVARKILAIRRGEKVLIVTNPRSDLLKISMALAKVAKERGAAHPDLASVPEKKIANPYVIFQSEKGSKDFMEDYVRTAILAKPNIIVHIPANKMGKDRVGLKKPYRKGKIKRHHILPFMFDTGQARGFWSPHITLDTWTRAIDIDYGLLGKRVKNLVKLMSGSEVHITTKKGTDLKLSLKGRKVLPDDGDTTKPHGSGNVPCGEVYVGPKIGSMHGTWVLDGMIPLHTGEILFLKNDPLTIEYSSGFLKSIRGKHAKKLLASIKWGEKEARKHFKGRKADRYAKNARHCGELGIGLNPKAKLVGTVLEDEKIMKTCHFAIGMNYEQDAPAMIHLDGVTFNPTIDITKDGKTTRILDDGELVV
tara:strand:- start:533 stop:1648 length:1116 start_codon:yes stop_codon:yes gene_type:complete